MAKFMTSLIVFSVFGALVSADDLAEMIARGGRPAPASTAPYHDYVGNTMPEILVRNNLPKAVNQAIDQSKDNIRAQGGRLYPHGLPNVMDPLPNLPRTPQQPIRNRAPPQPQRVPMSTPDNYIPQVEPVPPMDDLAARIAAGNGKAPLVESIRPQAQPMSGSTFDNLADRIANGRGQTPMVPTPRTPPSVDYSASGSDNLADRIAKGSGNDNLAEMIARGGRN